jgi:hypothetical protein
MVLDFFIVRSLVYTATNRRLKNMNERFFLKLLLVLFAGLIGSEVLVVVLFGLRLEPILLCFIVAAALTGIAFVVRLLLGEQTEIDSVSMRRAKQKHDGIMQDRLKEYDVDEEFIGGKTVKRRKGNFPASTHSESPGSRYQSAAPVTVSIEEAIRVHAEMYGGLGQLLQMMENIDDTSFGRLVQKAGLGELSRDEVILTISRMVNEAGDSEEGGKQSVLEGHSMDRESFDDYIRRSMNGAEEDTESADKGFSVELDAAALSRGPSVPPADFSHDPKSVISSLKRAGEQS